MPYTVKCLGNIRSNNSSFTEKIGNLRLLIGNKRMKVTCDPTMAKSISIVTDQRVKLQKTRNMPVDHHFDFIILDIT